jgi:hypothetical protein
LAMVMYRFDMSICAESKTWNNQRVFAFWERPPLMVTLSLPDRSAV